MTKLVPITERERLMLRNFVNDCATYDDKVLAVGLIGAYDDLPEHDPLAGMQEMRKQIETHLRDMAAVAQEHTVDKSGGRESDGLHPVDADPVTPPTSRVSPAARITFSDPGDGYDSAIRHHADFERGDL